MRRNFPGGPCPCQGKGHGFDPWSQKIPCAAEQLSLCPTTTEPERLEPGSATREVTTLRSPHTTTGNSHHHPLLSHTAIRESLHPAMKIQLIMLKKTELINARKKKRRRRYEA